MQYYVVSDRLAERLSNDHTYHAPFGDQALRYGDIREEARQFCYFLAARAPESRELSLALTAVEQTVFYANAAIARNEVERISLTPKGEAAADGRSNLEVVTPGSTDDPFTANPFPEPYHDRFDDILKEMSELHSKKGHDYGAVGDPYANVRASEEFGVDPWKGALIRLNDKITRLKSFIRNGNLANESALDSITDIAVYGVIMRILYDEQYGSGS